MGIHSDRGGIEDSVKGGGAESTARNKFTSNSASQFAGGRFTARTDTDACALVRQGERGSAGSAASTENKDAAVSQREFLPQSAHDANVIGVAAVKGAVAAHDDGIYRADGGGEGIAILQMAQDAFFMRDGDAEAAQTEVGRRFQKIAEISNEEGKVDSIDFARDKRGVMQQRGKGMRYWITDDAVHAGLAVEGMSAIQMLHFAQGNLPGSGGRLHWRVCERAAVAQGEQAGGKAHLTHGDGHAVAHSGCKLKEARAVRDAPRQGGHLDPVNLCSPASREGRIQRGHAFEIVERKQDALRQK